MHFYLKVVTWVWCASDNHIKTRLFAILFLLCTLSVIGDCHSWGKFWEIEKDKNAYICEPSRLTNDILGMTCIPANTTGFLMGDVTIAPQAHTVASITAFALAKYEVQYGDWITVRTWAMSNGYAFADTGQQGSTGALTNQDPVTAIGWRSAMLWCNAASEKQGLTPVYYTDASFTSPLRIVDGNPIDTTPGHEDNPYVKWSANGYRLPTEAEWEYAARYIDGVSYTPASYASGASADTANSVATGLVAWYSVNTATTQPVGTKAANALGIFDMSGNVAEWVWDWGGAYTTASPFTDADTQGPPPGVQRITRGGSISMAIGNLATASRYSFYPWLTTGDRGFRAVRRP